VRAADGAPDTAALAPRHAGERVPARVAVLASGSGSNLQALLDHAQGDARAYQIVLAASDRPGARALDRAAAHGVATAHLADPRDGAALATLLRAHAVDLVVLAGYLRLVPADVTRAYAGRMLNVHPALLPAFGGPGMYGLRVHAAVVASGARVSGPTVHFVDEEYDRGAIVAQWPVPVLPADTPERLAARVLAAEHALLPRVVAAVAAGRLRLGADGRVTGRTSGEGDAAAHGLHFTLAHTPAPPPTAVDRLFGAV
jgi:formyltetrahydrofolate-dependent phosphoribosylglycinamide formyltransferase